MAARRKEKRARTSAETKRGPRADEAAGQGRPDRSLARGLALLFGPPIASALLLTLAFPPAEISWLAYLALAPLLVTAVRARSGRDAFWAAFAAGLVFFGINLYWVQPITTAGYLALLPYVALYWAVGTWMVRRIGRATPLPLAVVAPVVWVALEFIRGWMISGLPWLLVGHTQYENLVLIQTGDALGAYGATFLCLATSGLVADLLVRPLMVRSAAGQETRRANAQESAGKGKRISRTIVAAGAVVLVAWAGTVAYGVWRLGQDASRPGPVVVSVQTAVPQEVKLKARLEQIEQLEEDLMREQMDLTDSALAAAKGRGLKADLICWPETMVPGIMNRGFLQMDLGARMKDEGMRRVFTYLQKRSRLYWSRIHAKARQTGVPILFGAHAVEIEGAVRLPGGGFVTRGPRRNTAFLVSPDSKAYAADHAYAKAHLVPFGEYVPFKTSWPWLHDLLQIFTPYKYDHSLTPGAHDQAPFTLTFDGRESRFQVAICYEDAMAYRVREMVRASASRMPRGGSPEPPRRDVDGAAGQETRRAGPFEETRRARKAVDFIVNISNDGWFVRGWFAADGTYELDQHLNLCVFRAVENRVAVVRSVNTGISAIISPTGRIQQVAETGGRRRNVTGYAIGRLTLDSRVAPYTRIGDAFALACLTATAGLVVASVVANRHRRKEVAA